MSQEFIGQKLWKRWSSYKRFKGLQSERTECKFFESRQAYESVSLLYYSFRWFACAFVKQDIKIAIHIIKMYQDEMGNCCSLLVMNVLNKQRKIFCIVIKRKQWLSNLEYCTHGWWITHICHWHFQFFYAKYCVILLLKVAQHYWIKVTNCVAL